MHFRSHSHSARVTGKLEALLQEGNQNDRVDARKLAELLQNNLRSVYHGDHGLRTLKELVRSYLPIA
jgi:two-component sensor histidine kinase